MDFLGALKAVRTAPGADRCPDHLTVIATSNGALLAQLGMIGDEQPLDDAGIETLRVFGLTLGHPEGSQLLLQAAAAAGPDSMNLQALLQARVPDHLAGFQIGERILNSMLRRLPEPLRDDLITCAAARTQEEAESLARSGLLETAVRDRVAVLSRAYWTSRDLDGRPVMHPLLRRLLLRELAARDRESPRGWAPVFGWLAKNVSPAEENSGRLHHSLALGEVERVAETLADLLATLDGEVWLHLVRSIVTTAVPTFLTGNPVHTVRQVVTDALAPRSAPADRHDQVATVAKLITAWQAANDPLVTVAKADLHAMVATGLDAVAESARSGFAALVGAADRHRHLARLWEGCGSSPHASTHRDLREHRRDAP